MDDQMAGFYKLENDAVLYADQGVLSPNYELLAQFHDQYTYPVDGWYWFDSADEAYAFFKIPKPVVAKEIA